MTMMVVIAGGTVVCPCRDPGFSSGIVLYVRTLHFENFSIVIFESDRVMGK